MNLCILRWGIENVYDFGMITDKWCGDLPLYCLVVDRTTLVASYLECNTEGERNTKMFAL